MSADRLIKAGLVALLLIWSFIAGMLTGAAITPRRANAEELPPDLVLPAPGWVQTAALTAPAELPEEWQPAAADVEMLAKLLYGEARGVKSATRQAAVIWCVLNRVDKPGCWGDSIAEVVTAKRQFVGYRADNPVLPELAGLAEDVLRRHHAESEGAADVGRVLPREYCYFTGYGCENLFTAEWRGTDYWGWAMASPYED